MPAGWVVITGATVCRGHGRIPNWRCGRWQGATEWSGQTIYVGGQVGHGVQPQVVRVTTARNFINTVYTLHGQVLEDLTGSAVITQTCASWLCIGSRSFPFLLLCWIQSSDSKLPLESSIVCINPLASSTGITRGENDPPSVVMKSTSRSWRTGWSVSPFWKSNCPVSDFPFFKTKLPLFFKV